MISSALIPLRYIDKNKLLIVYYEKIVDVLLKRKPKFYNDIILYPIRTLTLLDQADFVETWIFCFAAQARANKIKES